MKWLRLMLAAMVANGFALVGAKMLAEAGLGSEMVRAPKLPLAGAEREAILKIVRHAIDTRPAMAAAR